MREATSKRKAERSVLFVSETAEVRRQPKTESSRRLRAQWIPGRFQFLVEIRIRRTPGLALPFQLFVTVAQVGVDLGLTGKIIRDRAVDSFERELGKRLLNALGGSSATVGINDGVE